jgi:hypothetical protein
MKAALSAIEQTTQALQQQVTATVVGLGLRRDQQLLQGALTTRELLETAARTQVTIFEQDEQLYCYPSLVRVLASERSILIDRTCERRLRPSIATDEVHAVSWRSWSPTIFSNSNSRTTVAGSASYQALYFRIWDEVYDRNREHPFSSLVRIGGARHPEFWSPRFRRWQVPLVGTPRTRCP